MTEILHRHESFIIVGLCMEVYNQLGHGFSEIVYKDALELEFMDNKIVYHREKEYMVQYKSRILSHRFYADFIMYDKIVLEVKCVNYLTNEHLSQAINYLRVSGNKLALLVNFAKGKLQYQRVAY